MAAMMQLRREDRIDADDASAARTAPATGPAAEIAPRAQPVSAPENPAALAEPAPAEHPGTACAIDSRHPFAIPATRLAIARVLGERLLLRIEAIEGQRPVYQAVDLATGEIRREWTQAAFVRLVRGVREDVAVDVAAGLILDVEAGV